MNHNAEDEITMSAKVSIPSMRVVNSNIISMGVGNINRMWFRIHTKDIVNIMVDRLVII